MYIGDSITHGVNSATYRWELHKIFVDQGLEYKEVGIKEGNTPGALGGTALKNTTAEYGNVTFRNIHSAQSSGRAWELSGNASGGKPANQPYKRYDGSNVKNWFGMETKTNTGADYSGPIFSKESGNRPNRVCLMIGTNDLLSDTKSGALLPAQKDKIKANLIKDIDTIYATIKKAAPKAKISINLIPAWCQQTASQAPEVHQAVAEFNDTLRKWGQKHKNVTIINVNRGLEDVASEKPLEGIVNMFTRDRLHPNAQGDLIIAGNMAQSLRLGGRTAGLPRGNYINANLPIKQQPLPIQEEAELKSEYTVYFTASFGNGKKDGWDHESKLSVTVGNGSVGGVLNITEAYIKWGDTVLYSEDMSKAALNTPINITCVQPDTKANRPGGFYIWIGEKLIGESLPPQPTTHKGISIEKTGTAKAQISNFGYLPKAVAPPTSAKTPCNPNKAYQAAPAQA